MNTCHRQTRVPSARSPPKTAELNAPNRHLLEHGKGVLMDPVQPLPIDARVRDPPLALTHGSRSHYASSPCSLDQQQHE